MFNKSFGAPFGGGTGGFGTSSTFGQQNSGFGTTGGFGSSAFGTTNNTGGLFGATQNKPGGLFGSSTFSQPVTSSTSSGFGFGAASGTSNSLFGSTNTGGGGLFSQQGNAFGANKPASFGTFGTSTSSGGLFGTTSTTSNPFGGTSGSLFGSSGFTATQPGTTIKFNPPTGSDTMVKSGVTTSINTKHQCITAMKEYENKSLEELRLEDYQAGRKGPSNPMAANTGGLFGTTGAATPSTAAGLFGSSATNTGFSFGQNKTSFGTSTSGFGATTSSLFSQPQPANSLFKPFGQATTAQNTGFSFGNTNTMGLFGSTAATQTGGLFGNTANTSTATGFGTGTGLFGPNNTAFGNNLFGNKPAGFGTTTTSAPSFGTGTGLFGNKPPLTLGTNTNTSNFGFGANPAGGSLFGNKTATGGLGTGLGTSFGAGVGTGQTSLFGNNQNKMGSTLGTVGTFGATGFNTGTSALNFGAPQQPVALTDPNAAAAQQAVLQQQINALAYAPFGDSPLFRNPLSDPKKKEERLKPTNPAAQKALTTPTHYKLTPRPATRVRPKALTSSGSAKSQLFDGLDDDEPSLTNGAFMPRKSIKKLVLKNLNGSSLYSSPLNRETDDLASPSEYPQNGLSLRSDAEETRDGEIERGAEDDLEVSKFYTNPIAKPIPHSQPSPSLQDTITELNMRRGVSARNGLELSSEEISLGEDSVQEDRDEELEAQKPPHPAGIVLSRVGYYTIPSMEELGKMLNENGDCIVENFTVGRKGYGSVFFPGEVNLTNMNLDEIVHFRRKEVIVYPDDKDKPPVGEGLNRRAEVTLDGVWPNDKTTCTQIKSPERLSEMNYEGRLENASRRQGARFLEYRPETGSWVFEVAHFSKYGLQDSDEEEEVPPAKTDPKKMKTTIQPGLQQLPPTQQQMAPQAQSTALLELLSRVSELDSDMADITQEQHADGVLCEEDEGALEEDAKMALRVETPAEHEPVSASSQIASSLGINPHTLQIMKASLFAGDDECDPFHEQLPQKILEEVASPRVLLGKPQGGLSVGSLLQTKFLSGGGLLAHLPDVPFGGIPQKLSKPAVSDTPWPSLGPSFLLPPPVPEVTLRTVGARRLEGPVSRECSVTLGKGRLLMDAALYMGRSFRVGWGPNWTLVHCGDPLSTAQESKEQAADTMGFGFLPKPTKSRQITESPFKVHVEQVVGMEPKKTTESIAVYHRPLEIGLKHSTISTEDACPFIQPEKGVEALHEYAQWIVEVNKETGDAVLGHWQQVWTLCAALWGRLGDQDLEAEHSGNYQEQLARRRSFSRWLAESAAQRIQEEVGQAQPHSQVEAIFSYLTGHCISEACRLAQKSGDHRLSLLLSQAVGSQFSRDLLALQLADWNRMQTDSFIQEERLRIFALLAGKPVWESTDCCINVCSELDWKRCVAVHLWYMLPPTASVADSLAKYEAAFQGLEDGRKYACAPFPPYVDDTELLGLDEEMEDTESKKSLYDICFHLLKLYSVKHYSLQQLLDPSTVTADQLDYRLSWHLWNVLQALNYTHLSLPRQGLLHASYAAQLESAGLWEMAVFVLLHIPDSALRERAVREMLNQHCPLEETEESAEKERFLTDKLLIPIHWIHEAKAIRACRDGDKHREALHLYKAGHWNHCHRLVIQNLASDCIINDNHDYLMEFLEGLAVPERSVQIQDWDTSGRVYLDYIRVIQTLQAIQRMESPGYELERLHTDVTSLCSRIELLPCSKAKDRLAQSEMAKRVANILRVVLSLQQGGEGTPDPRHIPLCHLAPHIGRLPMPEDYALEELRSLTQSYLREYIVSH
ncbi:nuclear pore complex protein Nup98-Nup96 [Colossoma macropomum]|uniref:nuclear pore complex protein Nup98-Nup96 n=1 Tax=Colossoma macropomum TaxID=42526 RepID=UPI0018646187|nr:nuclear pore complex protein Nup98-Nup96 [Colossoma macropomum]XP_036443332.1 nuclear pore complex protein Nup98-Nup96 [Colossoma macropomum]XP_036443333.1 nuclear pore complex protein Nup98-Nup96 [Colossoma macropomum]